MQLLFVCEREAYLFSVEQFESATYKEVYACTFLAHEHA